MSLHEHVSFRDHIYALWTPDLQGSHNRIVVSSDDGESWQTIQNDNSEEMQPCRLITDSFANRLICIGQTGVYSSFDGTTWILNKQHYLGCAPCTHGYVDQNGHLVIFNGLDAKGWEVQVSAPDARLMQLHKRFLKILLSRLPNEILLLVLFPYLFP